MFERKSSAYIKDIITCCDHLLAYTNDLNFDEFEEHCGKMHGKLSLPADNGR
jgi:uncharacterized protein with HEPN domain